MTIASRLPTVEDYRVRPPHPNREYGGRRIPSEAADYRPGVVTVVTVSFNSATTIGRTIDSILGQRDATVEYIVIDGGSKDGTIDLLKRRSADIDLWISEPDAGISDAFNKGIALAYGEYIAMVNSDDWLEPNHLHTAISELEKAPVDFVFGDLALYAADGRRAHFFRGDSNYAARISHYMPFINHPTVVCRRTAFLKVGLFDPSLRTAMDYDWFLRLHKSGGLGRYMPDLLAHMTLDGQSDKNFMSALREVRDISIRQGYSVWAARARFAYRVAKGKARRWLQRWLPTGLYDHLRRTINVNYQSDGDRTR